MKTFINKAVAIACLPLCTLLLPSCDDTTDTIGSSLVDNADVVELSTDTFDITTRSVVADSVFARNTTVYLGKVRDPETQAYISSNFMSQFFCFENYYYPDLDSVYTEAGKAIADSCEIRLYVDDFYGDSLTAMKLTAYEMATPMSEGNKYYSNFDPLSEGLTRGDGLVKKMAYTLDNQVLLDTIREDDEYVRYIRIKLNDPYTDKNGTTYNNFGSYLMQKYYEDPKNYKDFSTFVSNVAPGFYFTTSGGLGSMAYIKNTQLNVYFREIYNDSVYNVTGSFPGTEEVLMTSNIQNDKEAIATLAADDNCTYLKTPAGIFTEITIPVESVMAGHETDTISTAKIDLQRINTGTGGDYDLDVPQTLLLLPKSDMYAFFENSKLVNYRTSYLATYNSTYNKYTFNNISSLVKYMYERHKKGDDSADWNKAIVVPVVTTTTTIQSSTVISKIVHDMSLTNTKLVGGPNNPIKMSVIYSK